MVILVVSNLSQTNLTNSLQPNDERAIAKFLRFYLYPDTKVMLSIEQITEVLKIQLGQIVPIPQMPNWVMGVYNWRGEILWMVDLGHLIGLKPWYQNQTVRSHHTAIVLSPDKEDRDRTDNVCLGLVVSRVEDLQTCDIRQIQSALGSKVSTRLGNFLQGYWLEPEGEMVLALDGKAIAAAMPRNST